MDNKLYLLITLYHCGYLYQVAMMLDPDMMDNSTDTSDLVDHYLEPENNALLRSMIPDHHQGTVAKVDRLSGIIETIYVKPSEEPKTFMCCSKVHDTGDKCSVCGDTN